MAGYRAFLRVIRVKHKVITPDKGEMKEAAAEAEAFYAASQRLRSYGMLQSDNTSTILGALDIEEILIAATKGFRAISVPRLTRALEHAATLRGQYSQKNNIIDPKSKLTMGDIEVVTSAAAYTLRQANLATQSKQRQKVMSATWLFLAFLAIMSIGYLIVRS